MIGPEPQSDLISIGGLAACGSVALGNFGIGGYDRADEETGGALGLMKPAANRHGGRG